MSKATKKATAKAKATTKPVEVLKAIARNAEVSVKMTTTPIEALHNSAAIAERDGRGVLLPVNKDGEAVVNLADAAKGKRVTAVRTLTAQQSALLLLAVLSKKRVTKGFDSNKSTYSPTGGAGILKQAVGFTQADFNNCASELQAIGCLTRVRGSQLPVGDEVYGELKGGAVYLVPTADGIKACAGLPAEIKEAIVKELKSRKLV